MLRPQLPDALDLLAVSVEAGLGFDGAIAKLTEHMDGPLVDEFALTLERDAHRRGRHDALKKLAERVAAPEVATLRARDHPGRPARHLARPHPPRAGRRHSRLKRQAAAEEKAMKAPIKMLFPTVIFIFPAMFIVILGPAMLNIASCSKADDRARHREGLRHRPSRAAREASRGGRADG